MAAPDEAAMFVRTAGPRDIAAIRSLLTQTWHATYDAIYGAAKVTEITGEGHSAKALQSRLERPETEFLVADDGARLGGVAYAELTDKGKTILLRQLYVLPALQGRGIGGMLLDEVIDSFPEAALIRLEVEEANARARLFYEGCGFAQTGAVPDCGGRGFGIPALVYERTLPAAAH